jgi:hypothetical protein
VAGKGKNSAEAGRVVAPRHSEATKISDNLRYLPGVSLRVLGVGEGVVVVVVVVIYIREIKIYITSDC